MLSAIIPARNEPYLKKTVLDLLDKASLIEVICVLDGYWPPVEEILSDKRVHYVNFGTPRGMRAAINAGVAVARGEYILKCDAHCMFAPNFDKVLIESEGDVIIPTRKRLDPERWEIISDDRPDIDYMYLTHPDDPSVWGGASLQGKEWREKNMDQSLKNIKVDDIMTAQGSCWFMKKDYYHFLELMDQENYGEFGKEMQEIGLKCILSGGRMVRNKNTWYAHWHKTEGRGYSLSNREFKKASDFTKKWVDGKNWHKQTLDFEFLINKFNPPGWKHEKQTG